MDLWVVDWRPQFLLYGPLQLCLNTYCMVYMLCVVYCCLSHTKICLLFNFYFSIILFLWRKVAMTRCSVLWVWSHKLSDVLRVTMRATKYGNLMFVHKLCTERLYVLVPFILHGREWRVWNLSEASRTWAKRMEYGRSWASTERICSRVMLWQNRSGTYRAMLF